MNKSAREIRTTGQLRLLLADAVMQVKSGDMDIDRANALHKLAKEISDSLYSEAKIAIFTNDMGQNVPEMGNLRLGGE